MCQVGVGGCVKWMGVGVSHVGVGGCVKWMGVGVSHVGVLTSKVYDSSYTIKLLDLF